MTSPDDLDHDPDDLSVMSHAESRNLHDDYGGRYDAGMSLTRNWREHAVLDSWLSYDACLNYCFRDPLKVVIGNIYKF